MKKLRQTIKGFPKITLICFGVAVLIFVASTGMKIAKAAWEEPSAEAPGGNAYTPLNIGPDMQTKQGHLLLDPLYNPLNSMPSITNQLEVRGQGSYFSTLYAGQTLAVDTDTLVANDTGVGIGTANPTVALQVADGRVRVTTDSAGVSAVQSQSSGSSGLYAYAESADYAAVYGTSASGFGVYGINEFGGTGVYGRSETSSAVVGSTVASYNSTNIIAGVYGQASGLNSWAGYFQQRLFGADQIIGRKFSPNRLQNSQIPYTAGYSLRTVEDSRMVDPRSVAFDGQNVWVSLGDYNNKIYLFNPETGFLAEEFPSSGNLNIHGLIRMQYAGGYIWTANNYDDATGVSRIDVAAPHNMTNYRLRTPVAGGNDGAFDFVYETTTSGDINDPYIWTVNRSLKGTQPADFTYSISRLKPYTDPNNPLNFTVSGSCLSMDMHRCSDGLDNDTDGFFDYGCNVAGNNLDTPSECVVAGGSWNPATADPDCVNNPVPGTGSGDDERLANKELGWPSGIAFDGTYLWISFAGSGEFYDVYLGEGIAKVKASDPTVDQTVYCPGPARDPGDIAYDSINNRVWIGYRPLYTKNQTHSGVGRFDPALATFEAEYAVTDGGSRVKFDDQSPDNATYTAPYIWVSNIHRLVKMDTDGVIINSYELPLSLHDFDFDRRDPANPYVWGAHSTSSLISRNTINDPYGSVTYIPKGASSGGITFDGTYVWSINSSGNTVSKYRSADGEKVADYAVGWNPETVIFDGKDIWTVNDDYSAAHEEISRINPLSGEKIGGYHLTDLGGAVNAAYDGRYMWITYPSVAGHELRRIDLSLCAAGSCVPGETIYNSFSDRPELIMFDGSNIWISQQVGNKITRIDANGGVLQNISISTNSDTGNIKSMTFDGTYIWVGGYYVDDDGYSLYKIDPESGFLVGRFKLYHDPGLCLGGANIRHTCYSNSDCPDSTCSDITSQITDIEYDGINIWATHGFFNWGKSGRTNTRECDDNQDNDADTLTDENDPDCWETSGAPASYSAIDMHEAATDNECADGLDNDGNGLCDWDGAVGHPGCSGKKDPACASSTDRSEAYNIDASYLSRITAATNQFVETVPYANGCDYGSNMIFDGTQLWLGNFNCALGSSPHILYQYFSGSGYGSADLNGLVSFQNALPGAAQSGSFALSDNATLSGDLTVNGDVVSLDNIWGTSTDGTRSFGESCLDGEFATGVDLSGATIECRPL
jgi:hypothetical protein